MYGLIYIVSILAHFNRSEIKALYSLQHQHEFSFCRRSSRCCSATEILPSAFCLRKTSLLCMLWMMNLLQHQDLCSLFVVNWQGCQSLPRQRCIRQLWNVRPNLYNSSFHECPMQSIRNKNPLFSAKPALVLFLSTELPMLLSYRNLTISFLPTHNVLVVYALDGELASAPRPLQSFRCQLAGLPIPSEATL